MKTLRVRTLVVSAALILSMTFAMNGIGDTLRPLRTSGTHASRLPARVTLPDGTSRTITLDGFGCSAAICSRVFVEGRSSDGSTAKIWIDGLSTIRDITPNSAVFTLKDGTQQRLLLITDFRVLYMDEAQAQPQRLDLSKIQSLQMLDSSK